MEKYISFIYKQLFYYDTRAHYYNLIVYIQLTGSNP